MLPRQIRFPSIRLLVKLYRYSAVCYNPLVGYYDVIYPDVMATAHFAYDMRRDVDNQCSLVNIGVRICDYLSWRYCYVCLKWMKKICESRSWTLNIVFLSSSLISEIRCLAAFLVATVLAFKSCRGLEILWRACWTLVVGVVRSQSYTIPYSLVTWISYLILFSSLVRYCLNLIMLIESFHKLFLFFDW